MAKSQFSQYHKDDLATLAGRLEKNYYHIVECQANCVEQLLGHEDTLLCGELYNSLSLHLVGEIRNQLRYRRDELAPYMRQLHAKMQSGHNCLNCAGDCSAGHGERLESLKAAHQKVKEILYRMSQVSESPPALRFPNLACRVLKNEIEQLDITLTELFYVEEAVLIPRIMEAQSQINAGV